jgi:hypothetical protein
MASFQHVPLAERYPLANHAYLEAIKLADQGKEYDHLTKLMIPEYFGMLKTYIQNMPDELAKKTIFGKAVKRTMPVSSKNKKK